MMDETSREQRFKFGDRLAREAGALALNYFDNRRDLLIEEKGPQDLVSKADREVEELIRERVSDTFPEDHVVGEEAGGDIADRFWIVDPIDGTSNFLRGLPYWCVALAFVESAEASMAFTFDAVHGVMYTAIRGQGAKRNGEPIRVQARQPDQACIALAHGPNQPVETYLGAVRSLAAGGVEHRRMGSIAMSLALLAEGVFDGVLTSGTNSWDVIGGLLLAEEAGALITPYQSADALRQRQPIASATPQLRDIIQDIGDVRLSRSDWRQPALGSV